MTVATTHRSPRATARAVRVRPIRTDADLAQAQRRIEALWGAEPGTAAGDELDVLAALVEAYEARHHPIPDADPRDVLRNLMESHGLTQRDLPEVGNQSVVSQILSGKRGLNVRHIQALAKRFAVPATVFMPPA